MSNQHLAPAFPHHPIQDKFGSVIMNLGLSKIELFTIIVASQLAAAHSDKYLPETIAEEAYNIALSTFEKLDEELAKTATNQPKSTLIHGKDGENNG